MKPTIIFDHVSKKFSRTYASDSLRDALAKPFKMLFTRDGNRPDKDNKQFWALQDVSFDVRPGEALGIIGPNGSGKTTTLKLLSRILRPDGGRIVVQGRVGALIELTAGFNPDLSGRENVFLNATILGMSRREIENKYDDIVRFAELQQFMDTPVKWYSTGMFARLGFSVAVHTNPDVLLVDEVLSVGDAGFQRKCFDKMRSYKAEGITIVFVSHNLQAVTSLCDRVILLSKGAVNCEGIPEGVISNYLNQLGTRKDSSNELIILTKGGLFDSRNEMKITFKSGEQGRVSIEILFKKDYPNFYISAYIRSSSESIVFSTNSMCLSGRPLSVKEGESASFSFDLAINLSSGVYELGTTVFDRTINKWVFNYAVTSFVVEEDPRFDGIAFMNPILLDSKVQS